MGDMHLRTSLRSQRTRTALCAVAVTCGLTATACSSSSGASSGSSAATTGSAATASPSSPSDTTGGADTSAEPSSASSSASSSSAATGRSAASGDATFLSSDKVHEISLTFDDAAYQEMLSAFTSSGDKQWIEVAVTIDGTTYAKAGARLKGNSSLRSLLGGGRGGFGGPGGPGGQNAPAGQTGDSTTATTAPAAESPESLPWLIRLDKYVDGQNHQGVTDFVVRSNSTQTALNEAVALDLLRTAGLASEQAALVRFTANGSAADLRLVIENLNDEWDAANFDGDGILYKAESTGDYTYRGTDPSAYDEVFEQESGGDDNLTPLVEFLDFVNNSDDATFAADLSKHLDVDSFARYLAFEELVDNFDDIDGPGNNSYLRWNASTGVMTVVAWDHNLAFGSTPGGPGGMGGQRGQGGQFPPGGGQFPGGGQPPAGAGDQAGGFPGGGRGGPGGFGRSNPLVTRFNAVPEFAAKVDAAKTALTEQLYTGGAATESLTRWSDLISSEASDLVDSATLQSEKASIEKYVQ